MSPAQHTQAPYSVQLGTKGNSIDARSARVRKRLAPKQPERAATSATMHHSSMTRQYHTRDTHDTHGMALHQKRQRKLYQAPAHVAHVAKTDGLQEDLACGCHTSHITYHPSYVTRLKAVANSQEPKHFKPSRRAVIPQHPIRPNLRLLARALASKVQKRAVHGSTSAFLPLHRPRQAATSFSHANIARKRTGKCVGSGRANAATDGQPHVQLHKYAYVLRIIIWTVHMYCGDRDIDRRKHVQTSRHRLPLQCNPQLAHQFAFM